MSKDSLCNESRSFQWIKKEAFFPHKLAVNVMLKFPEGKVRNLMNNERTKKTLVGLSHVLLVLLHQVDCFGGVESYIHSKETMSEIVM